MCLTRTIKRLLLTVLAIWIVVVPVGVSCQVQKALEDSAAMSWIREMEAKAIVEGRSLSPFWGMTISAKACRKGGIIPLARGYR